MIQNQGTLFAIPRLTDMIPSHQFKGLDLTCDPSMISQDNCQALLNWIGDLHNKSVTFIKDSLFFFVNETVYLKNADLLAILTLIVFIQAQNTVEAFEDSAEKRQIFDLFISLRSIIPDSFTPQMEHVGAVLQVLAKAQDLIELAVNDPNPMELKDAFQALAGKMQELISHL